MPRSSRLPCCRQARSTGRGGMGLAAVAGAHSARQTITNKAGLRCAATRSWWLLMVSRFIGL
ncbi:MAG: hypothetical protein ABFC57_05685 [Veillonellales bacterium]